MMTVRVLFLRGFEEEHWTDDTAIMTTDDEENLRRHAAKGAQAAIQAAKDKARAFDDATSGNRSVVVEEDPSEFLLPIRARCYSSLKDRTEADTICTVTF